MNRFVLKKLEDSEYDWICIDKIGLIVVEFKHKKFNDTQKFTTLYEKETDALKVAKTISEIGDWLRENHNGLCTEKTEN